MAASKRWTWTFFLDQGDWTPQYLPDKMDYLIYEEEICPDTGRHHLQGYIRLKKKTRMATVKKMLHNTCHLEIARGTEAENIIYCSKDRDKSTNWSELGEPDPDAGKAGRRTDLECVIADVESGMHEPIFICTDDILQTRCPMERAIQETPEPVCPLPLRTRKTHRIIQGVSSSPKRSKSYSTLRGYGSWKITQGENTIPQRLHRPPRSGSLWKLLRRRLHHLRGMESQRLAFTEDEHATRCVELSTRLQVPEQDGYVEQSDNPYELCASGVVSINDDGGETSDTAEEADEYSIGN